DVQRADRELGAQRRHRGPHDRAAVHPPRRQAARHRFGHVSGEKTTGGLAAAGRRSEAARPPIDRTRDHARWTAGCVRDAAQRRRARTICGEAMTFISRRDLLKRAAAVGAAVPFAGVGRPFEGGRIGDGEPERLALHALHEHATVAREPLESLTASEADLLDAIVARLIPTDANGPGATEAHAVRYIDRALGGALSASRQAYTSGLAALDRYARSSRGKAFADLTPPDRDAVLTDVEAGRATGFTGSSAAFFAMVLNHTHQGTFGDPYYGGN